MAITPANVHDCTNRTHASPIRYDTEGIDQAKLSGFKELENVKGNTIRPMSK